MPDTTDELVRKPKPFQHIVDALSGGRRAQKEDDEDDKEKKESKSAAADEDEENGDKKKSAADDEEENEDKKKAIKRKASDKDDEGRDNDERKGAWKSKDDPTCPGSSEAARIAASAPDEGNDTTDRADDRDPEMSACRVREQGRIRAIINSAAGKANPHMAIQLALNSSMTRRAAIAVLAGLPEPEPQQARRADPLRARMAEAKLPVIGPDGGKVSNGGGTPIAGSTMTAEETAALIVQAGKRRRGESQ